jgi:hypothetical protein
MQILRKCWSEQARFLHPSLNITEDGLLLGAGTCLAPMIQDHFGVRALDLDGREEHILALLSLAYQKPVSVAALKCIKRASAQWAKGAKALAHLELAYAGLPKFESKDEAYQLFCADSLIADGVSPHWLMRSVCLDTRELDLLKYGYDPGQPRVPAGSGIESGRWTSGGSGGSTAGTPSKPVSHGEVMSDANPDSVRPGQQYAQSVVRKDLPSGTPVEPYKELTRSFNELPPGSKQEDDETGLWHIGMELPPNSEARLTLQRRGQGADIDKSGFAISPPGSPPLPEEGSGKNPISGVRFGLTNNVTGGPYFRAYNDQGQPISPVTGRTVEDKSPLAHYPTDPRRFQGPF